MNFPFRFTLLACLAFTVPHLSNAQQTPPPDPPASHGQPRVLRIGISAADVRALIGNPAEIKPFGSKGVEAEVWVYRRLVSEHKVQEATGTWNRPYFDITANAMKHIPEPVYTSATRRVHEVTHLLLVEGRLVESKRFAEESKTYD